MSLAYPNALVGNGFNINFYQHQIMGIMAIAYAAILGLIVLCWELLCGRTPNTRPSLWW